MKPLKTIIQNIIGYLFMLNTVLKLCESVKWHIFSIHAAYSV